MTTTATRKVSTTYLVANGNHFTTHSTLEDAQDVQARMGGRLYADVVEYLLDDAGSIVEANTTNLRLI